MLAFIGTPGPWQIILVGMMLVLLFNYRLPQFMRKFLRPIDRQADSAETSSPWDRNVVLQLLTSIVLVLAMHYVIGPLVAVLCGLILAGLVLSRL